MFLLNHKDFMSSMQKLKLQRKKVSLPFFSPWMSFKSVTAGNFRLDTKITRGLILISKLYPRFLAKRKKCSHKKNRLKKETYGNTICSDKTALFFLLFYGC